MVSLAIPPRLTTPPDWLFLKGNTDDLVITRDMVSVSFWRQVDIDIQKAVAKGEDREAARKRITDQLQEEYVLTRRLAEAANNAYDREKAIEDNLEPARVRLLSWMKEHELFKSLETGSAGDVDEFLLSKVDPNDPEGGVNYNIAFLVNYLIPILEANSYSQDVFISIKENYSKTRALIGPLRRSIALVLVEAEKIRKEMLAEQDQKKRDELEIKFNQAIKLEGGPKKLLELFMQSLEAVNPATGKAYTNTEYAKKLQEIEQGIQEEHPIDQAHAEVIVLPADQSIFYIKCESRAQHRAIEIALGRLIDPHHGTVFDLINTMTAFIKNP